MQGPLEELLAVTEHGGYMSRFTGAPGHLNKAAQGRAHHVAEESWQAGSAAGGHLMSHVQYLSGLSSTLWTTSMMRPKPQGAVHVAVPVSAGQDSSARQDHAVAHPQSAGPVNATGG